MKPLVFSKENNNFEVMRLRKNLKGSLELNDFIYSSSVYDDTYNIAHFITLEDFKKNKSELKKGVKVVLSLLYCEEDFDGRLYKKNISDEYVISKSDIETINKATLVLVPSLKAKQYLILLGVKTKIEVLSCGVNVTKFLIKNTYVRTIAYRYLKCPEEMQFMVSVIDCQDTEAEKILYGLALSFPKIKFVVVCDYKHASHEMKKLFKKSPPNLLNTGPLEDDVYISLTYNAKAFLFVGSIQGNAIQAYEAMASETEIFALEASVYQDIVIDKGNGYVYNNFDSLKEGIKLFLSDELPTTYKKEKAIANENTLKNVGKKLIEIYKGI